MKEPNSDRVVPPQPAAQDGDLDGWRLNGLDYPSFRLSLVAKVMDRLTIRDLARMTDLTIAQWRVLSRLASAPGGLTVRQIAERAWVDRGEVSRAATVLEQRRLSARRVNPSDSRAPILSVTTRGMEEYRRIIAARSEFHTTIMRNMSRAECKEFDRLLKKLATELLDIQAQGDEVSGGT